MFRSRHGNDNLPKWYRTFSSVLTFCAAAVVCLCIVLLIVSEASGDGKSLFGHVILRVESESMTPALNRGDVISCEGYDGGELSVGDIVVFRAPSGNFEGRLICHRICEIISDGDNVQGIRTKGDAANSSDSWTLTPDDIEAVYEKKLPFITSVTEFTSSAQGKIVLIVVPLVFFFLVLAADSALALYLRKRALTRVDLPSDDAPDGKDA